MVGMNGKPSALMVVLCAALITDVVVLDDKKHTEPREPLDAVTSHLGLNQLSAAVRQKPPMRILMRKMFNGVVGGPFMHEVSYSLNEKSQIIEHKNRGTGRELCWQVRHITRGKCGPWLGKFASAVEAYQQAA
jgi:hypothetical protein